MNFRHWDTYIHEPTSGARGYPLVEDNLHASVHGLASTARGRSLLQDYLFARFTQGLSATRRHTLRRLSLQNTPNPRNIGRLAQNRAVGNRIRDELTHKKPIIEITTSQRHYHPFEKGAPPFEAPHALGSTALYYG